MKNLSPEQHRRVKQSLGCKEKPSIWRVCSSDGGMGTAEGGLGGEGGDGRLFRQDGGIHMDMETFHIKMY